MTKAYPGGTVAVDGLDLVAPSGKITVLVGPSGCGKTTTLRMVNRMIEPTSGSITIDDQDTAPMDAAELRRGIGYVIQHAGLFPHRTVADNIATVPLLLGWDKGKAQGPAPRADGAGRPRPGGSRDRYPHQLSGGQQQRVGVARALAADPPVMLMDEPFSAVDPMVREQLQDEFLRLQAELGKTIVFVTHDIDEAVKLGDQVVVLGSVAPSPRPPTRQRCWSDPYDDFVADFVGRDRGYRGLVLPGGAARRRPKSRRSAWASAATGAGLAAASSTMRRRPVGWVEPERLDRTVDRDDLHRGGTVASIDGSLRAALDAALSRPSGRGVVVDGAGALLGTVRASEVLALIEDGLVTWLHDHWSDVFELLGKHAYLAVLPLVVGLLLALPLGWLAVRYRRAYTPLVLGTGLLYTIPSLALFILMPGILGTGILDPVNVLAAMTIYTVALLTRTVADGLGSGARGRPALGHRHGRAAGAQAAHRRPSAGGSGDRRRAARGRREQRQHRQRGRPHRRPAARAALHRRLLP